MKACKGCGVEKELSDYYVAPTNSDNRMGKCKVCVRARVRANRLERAEQYAHYERSRANLPHRVEARREYQEEHKERIAEYKRSWVKNNGEHIAVHKRKYYELNREEVIVRSNKWAEQNPEKVRAAKADNRRKRRAAKHASDGRFTTKEFKELCDKYGNKCLRCGRTEVALEADHIVPLTRGGSDAISNIQPLCGSCNRSKFVGILDYRSGEATEDGFSSPQLTADVQCGPVA